MSAKYRIVGVFFFLGLAMATALTFMVDDEGHLFSTGYVTPYRVRVKDASSIDEGSFVRMSGIKIGRVERLEFEASADGKDMEIEVHFSVRKEAEIRTDSVASFKMASLLMGTNLDISPGTPQAPRLEPGGLVKTSAEGDIIASLSKVLNQTDNGGLGRMLLGNETVDNVAKITATLAKDAGLGKWLIGEKSLAQVDPIVENARAMVESIRKATEGREGTIARLLNDPELGRTVNDALVDIRESMKGVRTFADDLGKGKGALGLLVSDEETRKRVDAIVTDLAGVTRELRAGESAVSRLVMDRKMGDDLAKIVSNVATFSKGLAEGEGTLSRLINDAELYVEIKKLVTQAREAVEDAREAAPISTFTSMLFGMVQ